MGTAHRFGQIGSFRGGFVNRNVFTGEQPLAGVGVRVAVGPARSASQSTLDKRRPVPFPPAADAAKRGPYPLSFPGSGCDPPTLDPDKNKLTERVIDR